MGPQLVWRRLEQGPGQHLGVSGLFSSNPPTDIVRLGCVHGDPQGQRNRVSLEPTAGSLSSTDKSEMPPSPPHTSGVGLYLGNRESRTKVMPNTSAGRRTSNLALGKELLSDPGL